MSRVSWPMALVVSALIIAVTVLLAMGKPVAELMSLATLVLGALLYGEVREVKTQTNGNTHRMMGIVEKAALSGNMTSTEGAANNVGDKTSHDSGSAV